MGITKLTNFQMTSWIEELDETNQWLEDSTPENIFDFLNQRENLCTPGYILRRQIQIKFPELIKEASIQSAVDTFADLKASGNVAWQSDLVESLSELLSKHLFAGYGTVALKINKDNWQKYLTDKSKCNRDTAIKLIFALKMDASTATKFFLSNGNETFNLRNPFDYACQACLSCNFTYLNAVSLFKKFDAEFGEDLEVEDYEVDVSCEFTEPIKNETTVVLKSYTMSKEKVIEDLLSIMRKYKENFTPKILKKNQICKKHPEKKYATGYSMQNIRRLRVFLKYLTLLYPNENIWLNDQKIKTYRDGVPKVPNQLMTAFLNSLDSEEVFDLPEYWELENYEGPALSERGEEKRFYDNIPFNRNVLIPLKSLSKNIRATLRAVKHPVNAQAVDRDMVLLLTYFLVSAWHSADQSVKNNIQSELDTDIEKVPENSTEENFLFTLQELFQSLDDTNRMPLKFLIDIINNMLYAFDFTSFYAPFVLDRFILICMLSLDKIENIEGDSFKFLIQLVIRTSYPRSKKLMT